MGTAIKFRGFSSSTHGADTAAYIDGIPHGKATVIRGVSQWTARGIFYKADWKAPGFLNVASVIAGTAKPTDRDPTAPPLWGKGHRSSIVVTRTPAKGEAGLHLSAAVEDYSRTRALGANTTDFNVQMDDRWILQTRAVENIVVGTRAGIALGAELRGDRGDSINQRWPAGIPGINYTWNQDLSLLTYAEQ
jgi:hypothetical protein